MKPLILISCLFLSGCIPRYNYVCTDELGNIVYRISGEIWGNETIINNAPKNLSDNQFVTKDGVVMSGQCVDRANLKSSYWKSEEEG